MRCTVLILCEDVERDELGTARASINRLDQTPIYSKSGKVLLPKCLLWARFRGEPNEEASVTVALESFGTSENQTRAGLGFNETWSSAGRSIQQGVRLTSKGSTDMFVDLAPAVLHFGRHTAFLLLGPDRSTEASITVLPIA